MPTMKPSGWNAYCVAVLSVVGSILLTFALIPLVHQSVRLLPFVVAVLISAWYGGMKPGLAATFLCILSADYFFLEPTFKFWPVRHGDLALLILLICIGVSVSILTEKVHTSQAAILQSRERLDLATAATGVGIFESFPKKEDRIIWTPQMETLFGLDPGTFRGTHSAFAERVHPDDRDGLQALRADCECRRQPQITTQFRAIRPDGEIRWMEARCRLFYDDSGLLQRSVGVALDITGQKRIEEELKQSNQDLEQFATVVSHDLQTPLHFVEAFSKWLSEQYAGRLDTQADQYLKSIRASVQRMKALITGLLAHARFTGEGGSPALPVDCNEILARTLLNLGPEITATDARVTSDRLPTITARDFQIEELFQNLIHNALRYRRAQPPRVHASAKLQANEWVCSVEDNGRGFDMAESDRIFKPFERLYRNTKNPGAGMGLAICKRIVEQHGGRIRADSAPGKGSTFIFTIPQKVLYADRAGD